MHLSTTTIDDNTIDYYLIGNGRVIEYMKNVVVMQFMIDNLKSIIFFLLLLHIHHIFI